MDPKTALITSARRYCFKREPLLLPADSDPTVFHLSGSVLERADPRLDAEALERVLVSIEGIDIDRFSTFGDLQSHLLRVVSDATRRHLEFWHTKMNDETRTVMASLCEYIAELSPDAVRDVAPLPYRRPLSDSEVWAVWHRISERWGLHSKPPAHVDVTTWHRLDPHAFVSDPKTFDRAIPPRVLRSILWSLGITRIWKLDLPEERWSFEMDLAFLDTRCDWGECYWMAQDLDWILYISHEGEVVVAGTTLVERIRAAWGA